MEDVTFLIERMLFKSTGLELQPFDIKMENGGCINMALSFSTAQGSFFVKWNELAFADMFEKEAKSLEILNNSEVVVTPNLVGYGTVEEKSFLMLERIESVSPTINSWELLGRNLAKLHQVRAQKFGLGYNNYIGRLEQNNRPMENWLDFYRERRLNSQLGLAIYNKFVDESFVSKFKMFLEKLGQILPDSAPCLLHGDLWNGNVLLTDKTAYLIDPAIYYGAPEMDLAMTRLFGGFPDEFYAAYNELSPISNNFEELLDVYNLYSLMVHVNLFGPEAGYLGKVERTIVRYL